MLRGTVGKVTWLARIRFSGWPTAILAVVLGVATMAMGATGDNCILGNRQHQLGALRH